MKIWVLTILMVKSKLEQFTKKIDERVEKLSLDMVMDTNELYTKIVFWNDIKRRVVNAKVLAERMLHVMNEQENKICLLYAKGMSMQDIADCEKISKSSVCRKITYCAQIGARVLCSLGYDTKKLEEDYFDIEIIARTYKKLSKVLVGDNKTITRFKNNSIINNGSESKFKEIIIKKLEVNKDNNCMVAL